jgi:hypothetical protein
MSLEGVAGSLIGGFSHGEARSGVWSSCGVLQLGRLDGEEKSVTPGFKAKPNAHSICAQESSFHTYHTENRYRITNVSI